MEAILSALGIKTDLLFVFVCWALIFMRVLIVILLNPFLGGKGVPPQARMTVAIVLSLFLYPLIVPPLKGLLPVNKGIILALFFKEIFFGLTIGLVTTMVFYAIESAGRVVDQQRGEANAQLFVPQLGQVTIFGSFNYWMAVAFFLSIGGHRLFLKAFFESFQTVPLLGFPSLAPGFSPFLQFLVRLSGDVLIIAMQLAAPVLITVLLIDIVLGIANKMAPQINVFELGFAVKGYAGPLMIYISLLVLITQMDTVMNGMVHSIYQLTTLFAK